MNNEIKINIINLNAIERFKILIIYNKRINLRIIIKNKFKFINYINNFLITIENSIIKTRFYIINKINIKIILGFLFMRKIKLIFRYLNDYKNKLIYILFCNLINKTIISIKINTKIKNNKKINLLKNNKIRFIKLKKKLLYNSKNLKN